MNSDEDLIGMVRSEPILYDPSNPDYQKKHLKDAIWDRIAEDLSYPNGPCAKDRWLKLRNCHRDALRRKLPKGGGQPAQAPRPWKFESQMSFLLKHMTNRPQQPTNGTQELDILQDSLSPGESNQGLDNIKIEVHDDLADGLREEVESYGQQDEGSIILGFPTEAGKSDVSEERAGSDERSRDGDDLYHFFMAMYNSAKKMPLLSQLNLKRRIFNIVADEELYIYKRRAR